VFLFQNDSHGLKHKLNENSTTLWDKRLSRISNQRIQRPVLEEILECLDLSDFQVCIRCKGKKTNKMNFSAKRVKDALELIHIDIYGLIV